MEAASLSLTLDTHARLGLIIQQADAALAHVAARQRLVRRIARRARAL